MSVDGVPSTSHHESSSIVSVSLSPPHKPPHIRIREPDTGQVWERDTETLVSGNTFLLSPSRGGCGEVRAHAHAHTHTRTRVQRSDSLPLPAQRAAPTLHPPNTTTIFLLQPFSSSSPTPRGLPSTALEPSRSAKLLVSEACEGGTLGCGGW